MLGLDSTAVLPAGTVVSDQAKVSGSLSGSDDPLPSSCTTLPAITSRSGPASAMGAVLVAETTTVSGSASSDPSETMSWAT